MRPPIASCSDVARSAHLGLRDLLLTMADASPDPGVGAFAALLGIHRTAMADGRSRFELAVRPEHLNPHGVVHGGVVYALAEYARRSAVVGQGEDGP